MHEGACETGSAYVLFTQARVRCDNNLQQIGLCHDYNMKNPEKKSTVLDGFFTYLAQMITSMKGCVANNDLWPWPIYSRLFGPGLENHVCSVASTVLDGFFPYLVQMITSIRRCVVCDDLWTWPISSRSFDIDFENRVNFSLFVLIFRLSPWKKSSILLAFFPHLAQIIISIRRCVACNDLWPLTYIFKVIRPWPWKSCLLCSVYSSGWILSIFGTNDH